MPKLAYLGGTYFAPLYSVHSWPSAIPRAAPDLLTLKISLLPFLLLLTSAILLCHYPIASTQRRILAFEGSLMYGL